MNNINKQNLKFIFKVSLFLFLMMINQLFAFTDSKWIISQAMAVGTLTVEIEIAGDVDPTDVGAQWSVNEAIWYSSGKTVNLAEGVYIVTFRTLGGYYAPSDESVSISDGSTVIITGTYTIAKGAGIVMVTIPQELLEAGAMWNLNGGEWRDDSLLLNVNSGDYILYFKPIDGWKTPPYQKIRVTQEALSITAKYLPSNLENASTFWTEPDSVQHINSLSIEQNESKTLRLKADVPSGKTLKTFKFTIEYDSEIVSVAAIKTPGSEFSPANLNTTTAGYILFNGFNPSGVNGTATISFIDVTFTRLKPGSSNVITTVDTFGSTLDDQFKPIPEDLQIQVNSFQKEQIISFSAAYTQVLVDDKVNIAVTYSTSDLGKTFGLGIRFHYDSNKLEFDQFINVAQVPPPTLLDPSPKDDIDDFDYDAYTDKYVLLAWSLTTESFPYAALPIKLVDLEFTAISLGNGHINTSHVYLSDAYTYSPKTPLIITIVQPSENPPIISDINDQTISTGSFFTNIQLDNYVHDADNLDSELNWTAIGQSALAVIITNNTAIIRVLDPEWTGSETITFIVSDPTGLTASESVVFTVSPVLSAYWTDLDLDNHISTLAIEQGKQQIICFKAEVPSGKTLKTFKFTIEYDSDHVSFAAINTPGSKFPPILDSYMSGEIILTGSSASGVTGPTTIAFIDVTLTGLEPGAFAINTIVDEFGTDLSNEFKPTPEILHINVIKTSCHTKADFSYSQDPNNLILNFDASASTGQSYTWHFGDGSIGNGQYISHTYASPQNFSVTLIVADDSGNCIDSIQKSVQLMQAPTITLIPNQSITSGKINVIISSNSGSVEYKLNDHAWQTYSNPLYFTDEGHYQIVARLFNDKRFSSQPVSFEIDRTPQKLKVVKQKNGSVKLQWDYISGYETLSYHVYRSEMPDGVFYRVDTGQYAFYSINNEKVYYTDNHLVNGRTYYYQVKSSWNNQEGYAFSNMVSATPEKSFEFSCRSIDFESRTIVRNSRMAYIGDSVKYFFQIMPSEKFKGVIETSCNDLPSHVSYAFELNAQSYGASMHDMRLPATFVLNVNIGSAARAGEHQFKLMLKNVWDNASSNFWEIPLILTIKEKFDCGIFIDISKQPEESLSDMRNRRNFQKISSNHQTRIQADDILTYRVRKDEPVEIYGEILPKSIQRIHIQLESSDGQFVTSTTVQSDVFGKFKIAEWLSSFDLNEYKLSAQWTDYMSNTYTSRPRRMIIEKGKPSLTCNSSSGVLPKLNTDFTIFGKIQPEKSGRVNISAISPNNEKYDFDCNLDADGRYRMTKPFFNQRGIWKIKAYWLGNDNFIGCESNFLVIPVDVSAGRAIILGGGEGNLHNLFFHLTRKLGILHMTPKIVNTFLDFAKSKIRFRPYKL